MNQTPDHSTDSRIAALDALRGLAALAVCLYHFGHANSGFPQGVLKDITSIGSLGVPVFFVLSGYVIPLAAWRKNYRIPDLPSFMLARLLRLQLPYLAAIILVLVLGYASMLAPSYRGSGPDINLLQILSHIVYATSALGQDWLNPVFWTLSVEIQYYLYVALLFPFISSPITSQYATQVVLVSCLNLLGPASENYLPHWLPVFYTGVSLYRFKAGIDSKYLALLWVAALSILVLATHPLGVAIAIALASAVILLEPSSVWKPLSWLGAISYSLYLVHVPIGSRIMNLGLRKIESSIGLTLLVLSAVIVSIVFAAIFFKFVEGPSQRLARRKNGKNRQRT